MKTYTQSNTEHGNCWQTAVACILEVDPSSLPSQVDVEKAGLSYQNALNSYLVIHHRLAYTEIYDYEFSAVMPRAERFDGHHCLVGPTVRTPTNNRLHVVVGRFGEQVWDVSPSRAGLTKVERWGLLGDANERQIEHRKPEPTKPEKFELSMTCLCPECMSEEKRQLLVRFTEQTLAEKGKA